MNNEQNTIYIGDPLLPGDIIYIGSTTVTIRGNETLNKAPSYVLRRIDGKPVILTVSPRPVESAEALVCERRVISGWNLQTLDRVLLLPRDVPLNTTFEIREATPAPPALDLGPISGEEFRRLEVGDRIFIQDGEFECEIVNPPVLDAVVIEIANEGYSVLRIDDETVMHPTPETARRLGRGAR